MKVRSLALLVFVIGALPVTAHAASPSAFSEAQQAGQWYSAIGIHTAAGLEFGGEKLAELTYADGSKSSVHAGEGIYLKGGLTWTPLWFADRIGLGLGLDVGYKFKSTFVGSDGSVNLTRIPADAMVRGLVGLGKSWYVVGAAGLGLEFSPKLNGEGVLSSLNADFKDAVGGRAELGILRGAPHSIGAEITGSFTVMRYAFGASSFDAMHGGVNFVLHYFL